jgi:hypothetical protein
MQDTSVSEHRTNKMSNLNIAGRASLTLSGVSLGDRERYSTFAAAKPSV